MAMGKAWHNPMLDLTIESIFCNAETGQERNYNRKNKISTERCYITRGFKALVGLRAKKFKYYEECKMNKELVRLDRSIFRLFRNAARNSFQKPSLFFFLLKSILKQYKSAKLRNHWKKRGVQVPPFLIISVTDRCNLHCAGCYAQKHKVDGALEMSTETLDSVLSQAEALGISLALIAGGEPLVREDLFFLLPKYKSMIFPLFTNGQLLKEDTVELLEKNRNIVPIFSLEGGSSETDRRRGEKVYQGVREGIREISGLPIFWGVSLTVTRENIKVLLSDSFVEDLVKEGCRLFFYVEYVPVEEGTQDLVLRVSERRELLEEIEKLRKRHKVLMVAFPGEEDLYGGCLSAGRGFAHVNSRGDLEPCPFSPFPAGSLVNLSLMEALQSKFLVTLRDNHFQLTETEGGCALWEKREWVEELLQSLEKEKIIH